MAENLKKHVLTIAGIPSNKKVVKFKDAEAQGLEDKWYETGEKIQKLDLSKYGITSGATVEVSFTDEMKVVYMAKQKETKKSSKNETKEEVKVENTNEESIVNWTIEAVAKNKEVIKFKEDTEKWRKVSADIKSLDYEAVGIKKGSEVTVTLKDGVVALITVVANETEKPQNQGNYKSNKKSSYRDEESMDKRTASMNAKDVIVAMINSGMLKDGAGIAVEIKSLTNLWYDAINQL